ncbi:3-isopropylmalate dehydrogenase [Fusarium solani]
MAEHNIVVFAGDHCGPEVVAEAIKVIKTIEELSPTAGKFNLQDHLLGGCSIDQTGTPLTDEALAAAKAADAVLLGAIGGPKWGTGAVRPEQGLLKLRSEMSAYGNLRPCFFASDALVESSPPEGVRLPRHRHDASSGVNLRPVFRRAKRVRWA